MKNAELFSDLLARETRERQEAAAHVVMGKGWPFAAAASDIDLPGGPNSPDDLDPRRP